MKPTRTVLFSGEVFFDILIHLDQIRFGPWFPKDADMLYFLWNPLDFTLRLCVQSESWEGHREAKLHGDSPTTKKESGPSLRLEDIGEEDPMTRYLRLNAYFRSLQRIGEADGEAGSQIRAELDEMRMKVEHTGWFEDLARMQTITQF